MNKAKIKVIWVAETNVDLGSRLIMWFQGTPYSHVGLVYLKTGKLWHAIPPMVTEDDLEEYMKDHKIVLEKEVELDCTEEAFEAYLEGERGKKYSNRQLVRIALRKPMELLGLAKDINGNAERICSEFIGWPLFLYSIYKLSGNRDYWTPECLAILMKPEAPSVTK